MQKKIFFKDTDGLRVCGILSEAEKNNHKNILILVHGLGMSKESRQYLAMQDILNSKGISTLRIDLFGHGESEGEFEDLTATKAADDILKSVEYVKSKGYKKIGLIGGSFGGFTGMIAASKSKDLTFLILVSPASTYSLREIVVNGRRLIRKWKEFDYKQHVEGDDRERRFKYEFFRDFMKYEPEKLAKKVNAPVLIIHGAEDDVIPAEKSFNLVGKFKDCIMLLVGGADHVYSRESDFKRIVGLATDFVMEHFEE